MKLMIETVDPYWSKVFKIPRGTVLHKGKKGISRYILQAASEVTDTYGCYAWASDDEVYYSGSFSEYVKFISDFEGRVYQYLTNHKRRQDGSPSNTNARIFDLLNAALQINDVALQILGFDHLKCVDESVAFSVYAEDSYLVKAVERLLIAAYKRIGQCEWNDS